VPFNGLQRGATSAHDGGERHSDHKWGASSPVGRPKKPSFPSVRPTGRCRPRNFERTAWHARSCKESGKALISFFLSHLRRGNNRFAKQAGPAARRPDSATMMADVRQNGFRGPGGCNLMFRKKTPATAVVLPRGRNSRPHRRPPVRQQALAPVPRPWTVFDTR